MLLVVPSCAKRESLHSGGRGEGGKEAHLGG